MKTRPFHPNCGKLVKCDECSYWDWCGEVYSILVNNARVRGEKDNESIPEFFERCRGDEPWDSFQHGDSAQEYARLVMMEAPDSGDTGYMEELEL